MQVNLRYFLVISFLALPWTWLAAHSGERVSEYYPATIYKNLPGLPSNRISDILQSANGEIWFATHEGLVAYDGVLWQRPADSLSYIPNSGNIKMARNAQQILYAFGARSGKFTLARHDGKQWSAIPLPTSLAQTNALLDFKLAADTEGTSDSLAIVAAGQLFVFAQGKWWEGQKPVSDDQIIRHAAIVRGALHLTTPTALIRQTPAGSDTVLHEGFRSFSYEAATNTYYLLRVASLWKYSGGKLEKLLDFEHPDRFGYSFTAFVKRLNNRVFFAFSSPMQFFDLTTRKHGTLLTHMFENDYTTTSALIDHEQNLWVCTLRGAFKMSNFEVYRYDKNQLLENEVSAALETEDGNLLLGTNSGLSVVNTQKRIHIYPFRAPSTLPRVMDMVEWKKQVYVAANSQGIYRYEAGRLTPMEPVDQLSKARIVDIAVYEGQLYAAGSFEVFRYAGGQWQSLVTIPRAKEVNRIIRKIIFYQGRMLLLTSDGLYDPEKRVNLGATASPKSNIYTGLVYGDKLLLGTFGGLMELNDEELVVSPLMQFASPVYSLLVDSDSLLWIGTDQGIRSAAGHEFTIAQGLTGNEINRNAFLLLRDGLLLIGTDEGVTFYQKSNHTTPVPSLEITEVSMNNELIDPDFQLEHYQNNLKFHFRAISFFDEQKINYRVRLLGFEQDWQLLPYHTERSVQYTNLSPGIYQFEIQARMGEGAWSPSVFSKEVTISEAIYNARWFKATVLLILVFVIILIVQWRNRQLKLRNAMLKSGIRQKTKELHDQNEQLQKTIDNLKNTQGQLIQSEKLASMGHLTAGIAHEMNNPLNYIRGGAECLSQNLMELNDLHNRLLLDEHGSMEGIKLREEFAYLMKESQQLVESILNGAEKSTNIVKSLSSFTADAQNFYSFVDMGREIETALTLLNNQIGFRIVINRLLGNVPRVECYPAKINQMIVNILLNSIQAITDEGEITIRLYRKDVDHVGLEISDTGEGVDLDSPEKVFEPFFTTKENNPGLGLTSVRSIVKEHHGEVVFLSKKHQGSKLSIVLPLRQTFHPELDTVDELVADQR